MSIPLDSVDWGVVKEIFGDALDVEPGARRTLVKERCAGDAALRRAVETLLRSHAGGAEFLDDWTVDDAAERSQRLAPPESRPDEPPAEIGPYRVRERIGEGGFGHVYRAEQRTPIERTVAIKLLKPGVDSEAVVRRFQEERDVLARLDHPSIVRILDAGATPEGLPFVVMDLVDGTSIVEYAEAHRLTVRERVQLVRQACRAIHHAHQRAVLHRDVKPSNLLVTEIDGAPQIRVIDFGIARALSDDERRERTRAGDRLGTPRYMSPEQLYGTVTPDVRIDVYALGVVLCEVLTGAVPRDPASELVGERGNAERSHQPERPSELVLRPRTGDPDGSHVLERSRALRGDLDRIVLKAVEWDADRRYDSASALADDLERWLDGRPVEAATPGTWYRVRKMIARHRLASTFAIVALLAVLGGGVLAGVGFTRAVSAGREAERQALRAEFVTQFMLDDMLAAVDPDIAQGRDVTVVELLDAARLQASARFGDDPEIELDVLGRLGIAYARIGRNDVAEVLLARSVQLADLHGAPERAVALRLELAELVTMHADRHADALAIQSSALAIARDELGPTHALTLRARVANAGELGDSTAIIAELTDVLDALRRGGGDPVLELRVARKLAVVYGRLGATALEIERLREAERVARVLLGEVHSERLAIQHRLARALIEDDQFDEGRTRLHDAIAVGRRLYEPESSDFTGMLTQSVIPLARSGGAEEAVALGLELLDLQTEAFGEGSIPAVTALHHVGVAMVFAERFGDAASVLAPVLRAREAQWGPTHRQTTLTRRTLAEAEHGLGHHSVALALIDEALEHLGDQPESRFTAALLRARIVAAIDGAAAADAALEDACAVAREHELDDDEVRERADAVRRTWTRRDAE